MAELAAPASDSRAVAGGVAWFCEGTTCKGTKGNSRPLRICRGLAREFGEITSFTAKGEALAEDKLAECNGKPEPLKEALKGMWSRRITREHRLIHVVVGTGGIQTLVILQCRYHD